MDETTRLTQSQNGKAGVCFAACFDRAVPLNKGSSCQKSELQIKLCWTTRGEDLFFASRGLPERSLKLLKDSREKTDIVLIAKTANQTKKQHKRQPKEYS